MKCNLDYNKFALKFRRCQKICLWIVIFQILQQINKEKWGETQLTSSSLLKVDDVVPICQAACHLFFLNLRIFRSIALDFAKRLFKSGKWKRTAGLLLSRNSGFKPYFLYRFFGNILRFILFISFIANLLAICCLFIRFPTALIISIINFVIATILVFK